MDARRLLLPSCLSLLAAGLLGLGVARRDAGGAVEQADVGAAASKAVREAPESRQQHLLQLGAQRWHDLRVRGAGQRIAILDRGFRGYQQHLGDALPPQVRARSFRADGNLEAHDSQHGVLCAEVLHAVAPDAELLLANWDPDRPDSFLQAVRWARQQGARLLSCSLIMPGWSDGEGGGQLHRALDEILGDDVLFFACAGNTAERHWSGTFQGDPRGAHCWKPGRTRNTITPWGRERIAVELYGQTDARYELQVFDSRTLELVAFDTMRPAGPPRAGRAVVRFLPAPDARYFVALRGPVDGPRDPDEKLHVVVLGGSLEISASQGSIPFPADGARVLAVGAVDAAGQRASYSSCGPNSRLPKPDFVAPVPFPSQCRKQPFAGTSAAAPQAAGLAALLWSRMPSASAAAVAAHLRRCAMDLGAPGHDWETGYGMVRLPPPAQAMESPFVSARPPAGAN